MYFFTPDTIVKANEHIKTLDPKIGGLLCVLHCLTESIEENVSYEINGGELRKQLSIVFDKEPKEAFENVKSSYIIFAKDWASTFFDKFIKNRVDLLSCAIFFLRRYAFEKECTKEEIVDIFIKHFNLEKLEEQWFCNISEFEPIYNQYAVEDNQSDFYTKMGYGSDFKSILFDDVIKKSAADLKAAGQIQTLYSGSGVHECFLLSNEPLDKRYVMNNKIIEAENIISLRGIAKGVLTIEHLIDELKNMYNNPENTGKSMTPHLFGFKYGAIIEKNNYSIDTIAVEAGLTSSYGKEIRKGVNIYKAIKNNEYGLSFLDECTAVVFDYSKTFGKADNIILYGVPGCGKSHYIENKKLLELKVKEENKIRTTFYQDYSNTDFVGQILPKVSGEKVEYIFNPGPFTLALIQAYKNPKENVALIIEEINRGNAPAIFGDIFQLLDRKNGVSEYGIKNVQVIDYLNDYNFGKVGEDLYYHFDEIKIPGNLYIYATMNTSDQNVYTLDTAFTRRWDKEKIPNKFVNDDDTEYFKKYYVPGTNCLWETFANTINNYIGENLETLQVNEDKLVGAYFVKGNVLSKSDVGTDRDKSKDGKELKEKFAYKVLDYLWSDVSKLDHSVLFKSDYNTLDKLVEAFAKKGLQIFQDSIFRTESD